LDCSLATSPGRYNIIFGGAENDFDSNSDNIVAARYQNLCNNNEYLEVLIDALLHD
jgi:hypothetical protein